MKLNNPMKNPETVQKMKDKAIGRTFLSRGGNGKMTVPQLKLWVALELPKESLEFAINTAMVRKMFICVPNHYKVDIGIETLKLAIEVDGATHNTKKWKFLDARKTEILNALGWKVLRFKNQQIMENLEQVLMDIKQYMI
jgi:very-short-patch-repair endonuclease